MPKPISPEQLETLQANGVIVPGFEAQDATPDTAMEAGLLVRTLGSVGLPHAEIVDQIEDPDATPASSLETINAPGLEASYRATHETVSLVMGLIGEPMPAMHEPSLVSQLDRLKPFFEAFEARGLEPEVVLRPAHRPLSFWENLAQAVQNSALNPDQGNEKVLRGGGLWVADEVRNEWTELTNPDSQAPAWKLEVVSSLERPKIVNITGYGYTDNKNENPSTDLNQILQVLNQAPITDRSGRKGQKQPLTQSNVHPSPDGYLMHQLTRIIQEKTPLDSSTWSWLNGTLNSGGVPAGRWDPGDGQVFLYWDRAGGLRGRVGVRPSGRG